MEGAIESFLSSPHTTLADYALVVRYIIAVWAAVQPARPQFRGSLALIDLPDTQLRPLDLYIVGKLSRRRIRRLQYLKMAKQPLKGPFFTHTKDI